jgi:hypothetical protein
MKNDPNLLVTVSNRNNRGRWQVFATNGSEGLVFGVRNFTAASKVRIHAETLADRLSCRMEIFSSSKVSSSSHQPN